MKNIIYQYWKGDLKPGVLASTKLMKQYAESIGAEHRFDHNIEIASKTVSIPIAGDRNINFYYEPANPLIDSSFDEYDNVALIDIDVFPVDGLKENLFDAHKGKDAGICTEPMQPHFREIYNVVGITSANDKHWTHLLKNTWDIDYSYDDKGRPMVYNTGVMIFSKAGLKKAKETWPSFQEYVDKVRSYNFPNFFSLYQDYASAFLHMNGFEFERMDNDWNRYVHKLGSSPNATVNDTRSENTKFVHIMFSGADDWDEETLHRVTNLPIAEWKPPVRETWPN